MIIIYIYKYDCMLFFNTENEIFYMHLILLIGLTAIHSAFVTLRTSSAKIQFNFLQHPLENNTKSENLTTSVCTEICLFLS